MNRPSLTSRVCLPLAWVAALAIGAPTDAAGLDWTAEEIHCAQRVGVDLLGVPEPGSRDYVKRLAWSADLIVYGVVDKIRFDANGPYATNVRLIVLSVKKGKSPKGPLTVALVSGPKYSATLDGRLDTHVVNEPSFAVGETVLLFLTKGTPGSTSAKSYELPENSFLLVDHAIDGVTASLQGSSSGEYNVVHSDYQIREVVEAQATNCK